MKDKISKARFGYNDFIALSEEYHDLTCEPGQACIVYSRKESKLNDIKFKWRFGLAIGSAFSNTRNLIGIRQRERYFYNFVDANETQARNEAGIIGDISNVFEASERRPALTNQYLYPALTINVSNKWRTSLQAEFQFHHNTYTIKDLKTRLTDLEMLLMAHRNFRNHTRLKPFIEFGLTFYKPITRKMENTPLSYNVPIITDGKLTSRMDKEVATHDINFSAARLNAGAAIGFGMLYSLENEHQIELKLLWDYHEEKIQGIVSDEYSTNQKFFINNLLLQLGYNF